MTYRLALLLLIFFSISMRLQADSYRVTSFGEVSPFALSDSGHVAGTLRRAPDSSTVDHPFYWRPDSPNGWTGTLTELPLLPNATGGGHVHGINSAGQIVGSSDSPSDDRAVLWSPTPNGPNTHSIHDLGNTIQTNANYLATGINSIGQVVGNRGFAGSFTQSSSFLWTPQASNGSTGMLQGIPGLAPYSGNVARDINDAGQITGYIHQSGTYPDTINRGYVWQIGSAEPVNLGLPPGAWNDVYPLSINNHGQVVGYAVNNLGRRFGFLWTPTVSNGTSGEMRLLDVLQYAVDINDAGTIVAFGGIGDRAYVWTESSGAVEIDDLIDPTLNLTLHRAVAINNRGQILAWGYKNRTFGYLLTPVPEASTLTYIAFSLCAIGVRRSSSRASAP